MCFHPTDLRKKVLVANTLSIRYSLAAHRSAFRQNGLDL